MSKENTEEKLFELRQSLLQDLERGSEAAETVKLEQNKVGRLSRMDALQQQAMQNASRVLIQKRLVQIDKALAAVKIGDYGFCELCGDEIPESRLEVRPEALSCVSCQEKSEQR